jgi:hypothetical protein
MSKDRFRIQDNAVANVVRNRALESFALFNGFYDVEHLRSGLIIGRHKIKNDVLNDGKNKIFNVMFNDVTPISNANWCIGLINSTSFSAIAAADTMASHAGWIELTAYTQANRVAWGSVTSTAQAITNSTPATFDMNAANTVKGIFVCSNNTKSGTSGTIWSAAQFSSDVPVVNGDQLKITYTCNA